MAVENPDTPREGFDPDLVARRRFDNAFRGFDQHQVRTYLEDMARWLRISAEREETLLEQLSAAEARLEEAAESEEGEREELDNERLTQMVGAETARVLVAAQEAARDITAKAESRSDELIAEAEEKAQVLQAQAEGLLAERAQEAEEQAAQIMVEVERKLADADSEVIERLEVAQAEGERLVAEARVVREKTLRDMARRRNVGRQQVERLRAGRDRLLEVYEFVRGSLDEVTAELEGVLGEAKLVADKAAEGVDIDLIPTVAELEEDVEAALRSGLVDDLEIDAEVETARHDAESTSPESESESESESCPSESEPARDEAASEPPPDVVVDGPIDESPIPVTGPGAGDDQSPAVDASRIVPSPIGAQVLRPERDTRARSASHGASGGDDVALSELPDPGTTSGFEGVRILGPDPASKPTSRSAEPAGPPQRESPQKPTSRPVVTTPAQRGPTRRSTPGRSAEVLEFRGRAGRGLNRTSSVRPDDRPRRETSTEVSNQDDDSKGTAPTVVSDSGPVAVAEVPKGKAVIGDTPVERTEVSEAETEVQSSSVEDVLARLRSGVGAPGPDDDTGEVGDAEVVANPEPADDPEPAGPAEATEHPGEVDGRDTPRSDAQAMPAPAQGIPAPAQEGEAAGGSDSVSDDRPAPVDDGDPAIIESRDELIAPITKDLARTLKRVLSDDQNELLSDIRSRGVKSPMTDEDLGDRDAMVDRYRIAATEALSAAADHGAGFRGVASPGTSRDGVGDVAAELAESVAIPLHERLVAALQAGDADSVDARIRSGFRAVRTGRINALVDHGVLAAFNRGRLTSLSSTSRVRWVFDSGSTSPCPDCHDNSLSGGLTVGEAFPTGHAHPPIHEGCRCVVVPEPR